MKTLLKILLISSSLYGCGVGDAGDKGSGAIAATTDSALNNNEEKGQTFLEKVEAEKTTRQINEALLSSKKEIINLRAEVSKSLTKSDLTDQEELLLSRTILQLQASSDVIDKQLEDILVGDLQNSREKLNQIVKKMKGSERELGAMIARLDKITAYMEVACTLMQTLIPIPKAATPAKSGKETRN
jgi:hypothetical protein